MVKIRKGMVEAILLPYFDLIDLARFSGLSKNCRKLLNPQDRIHVNFYILFKHLDPEMVTNTFHEC
jgi:hypothetical protein